MWFVMRVNNHMLFLQDIFGLVTERRRRRGFGFRLPRLRHFIVAVLRRCHDQLAALAIRCHRQILLH